MRIKIKHEEEERMRLMRGEGRQRRYLRKIFSILMITALCFSYGSPKLFAQTHDRSHSADVISDFIPYTGEDTGDVGTHPMAILYRALLEQSATSSAHFVPFSMTASTQPDGHGPADLRVIVSQIDGQIVASLRWNDIQLVGGQVDLKRNTILFHHVPPSAHRRFHGPNPSDTIALTFNKTNSSISGMSSYVIKSLTRVTSYSFGPMGGYRFRHGRNRVRRERTYLFTQEGLLRSRISVWASAIVSRFDQAIYEYVKIGESHLIKSITSSRALLNRLGQVFFSERLRTFEYDENGNQITSHISRSFIFESGNTLLVQYYPEDGPGLTIESIKAAEGEPFVARRATFSGSGFTFIVQGEPDVLLPDGHQGIDPPDLAIRDGQRVMIGGAEYTVHYGWGSPQREEYGLIFRRVGAGTQETFVVDYPRESTFMRDGKTYEIFLTQEGEAKGIIEVSQLRGALLADLDRQIAEAQDRIKKLQSDLEQARKLLQAEISQIEGELTGLGGDFQSLLGDLFEVAGRGDLSEIALKYTARLFEDADTFFSPTNPQGYDQLKQRFFEAKRLEATAQLEADLRSEEAFLRRLQDHHGKIVNAQTLQELKELKNRTLVKEQPKVDAIDPEIFDPRAVLTGFIQRSLVLLGRASAVPKEDRILSMDIGPSKDGTFEEAFQMGQAIGVQDAGIFLNWNIIETGPATYDEELTALLEVANSFYSEASMPVNFSINMFDANLLVLPDDLQNKDLNDPIVINRFKKMLDHVFSKIPNVKISTINLGSEIDIYLGTDSEKWEQFTDFFKAIRDHIKAKQPDIKVAAEATFDGIMGPAKEYIQALNQHADVVGVSYYPFISAADVSDPDDLSIGDVKDPIVVHDDFLALTALYKDKPIVFYQIGYPSSPLLNSSKEKQRQFYEEVFKAWDQLSPQIDRLYFTWLHDRSPEDAQADCDRYGCSEKLLAYLSSLGLRTYEGVDKPAFEALKAGALARGW